MNARRSRTPRRTLTMVVASLALAAGMSLASAPDAGASGVGGDRSCTVTNASSGHRYGPGGGWVLQTAIDHARPGSTLQIRGRCTGAFEIDKRLSLVGKWTERVPVATLFGDADIDAAVVTVGSATVSISNLLITRGGTPGDIGMGRGVLNHGTLTIARSTVMGHGAATGGGIFNEGTLDLVRSTVSGNSAGNGAGIYNVGDLTIRYSTVSQNTSAGDGGGVYSEQSLRLSHSTVGDNVTAWVGGGLYVTGQTQFEASIVSGNLAGASGPECAGEVTSNGYNLVFTTDGFYCAIEPVVGDQIDTGADAMLLDLAFNGGSTMTMALPWASPAVNAIPIGAVGADGVTPLCPATKVPDQRGVLQPQGGACDIGSFEKKG